MAIRSIDVWPWGVVLRFLRVWRVLRVWKVLRVWRVLSV